MCEKTKEFHVPDTFLRSQESLFGSKGSVFNVWKNQIEMDLGDIGFGCVFNPCWTQ